MQFSTTNSPIPTLTTGSAISMQSSVAAADAGSVGSFHVRMIITDVVSGSIVHDKYFYNQSLTMTPLALSDSWVNNLPSGNYRYGVWIYNSSYSIIPNSQTYSDFAIAPAVASLDKVSGDNLGVTVNASMVAPLVVLAKDANGNPVAGVTVNWTASCGAISAASSVTGADGTASVMYTGPSTPQKCSITASTSGLSAQFSQTAHILLYGKHWTLPTFKPAGSGDPLAGCGFIPDTGDAFTLITGASDEFDGSALDTTKWKTRYIYSNGTLDYLNDELERYIDNHVVSNGSLKLTARPRAGTTGHASSPSGDIYPLFDSSMIRSITTFKYGYFEMRAKMPPGMGVWPAFWINPQVGWPPEIDIVEYVRNNTTELPSMIHHNVHPTQRYLYQDLNTNTQYAYWRAPSPLDQNYFTDDFHVFGCFWDETAATIHIDGQPVAAIRCPWLHSDGSDGGMAHLLLNLAMGGAWPTNSWTSPVALDDQIFEIDYVRVYQKSNQIITGVTSV